jgi:hypothetical protein
MVVHDISNSGLGGNKLGARIRSFWNMIYCHRTSADQSKFIQAFKGRYNNRRTQDIIASLPKGRVMVRDEVNDIEQIIMPYADSSDVQVARQELLRLGTPDRQQIMTNRVDILPEEF